MQQNLYNDISLRSSKIITRKYSTSFSFGISLLSKQIQYAIYGFVRIADEIVDTFHGFEQEKILKEFKIETYRALDRGISTNPVLQAFQETVNKYRIPRDLIECFLNSMEMDLHDLDYDYKTFKQYILGSAGVVGLMCLKVFCLGDEKQYEELKPYAMALGSAFQKINFLRDLKADYKELGRSYFPDVDLSQFSDETKAKIEADIEKDFKYAKIGIAQLPKVSRLGVYVAYVYYWKLFKKIKSTPSDKVMDSRIRIPNGQKFYLMFSSYVRHNLNLL